MLTFCSCENIRRIRGIRRSHYEGEGFIIRVTRFSSSATDLSWLVDGVYAGYECEG